MELGCNGSELSATLEDDEMDSDVTIVNAVSSRFAAGNSTDGEQANSVPREGDDLSGAEMRLSSGVAVGGDKNECDVATLSEANLNTFEEFVQQGRVPLRVDTVDSGFVPAACRNGLGQRNEESTSLMTNYPSARGVSSSMVTHTTDSNSVVPTQLHHGGRNVYSQRVVCAGARHEAAAGVSCEGTQHGLPSSHKGGWLESVKNKGSSAQTEQQQQHHHHQEQHMRPLTSIRLESKLESPGNPKPAKNGKRHRHTGNTSFSRASSAMDVQMRTPRQEGQATQAVRQILDPLSQENLDLHLHELNSGAPLPLLGENMGADYAYLYANACRSSRPGPNKNNHNSTTTLTTDDMNGNDKTAVAAAARTDCDQTQSSRDKPSDADGCAAAAAAAIVGNAGETEHAVAGSGEDAESSMQDNFSRVPEAAETERSFNTTTRIPSPLSHSEVRRMRWAACEDDDAEEGDEDVASGELTEFAPHAAGCEGCASNSSRGGCRHSPRHRGGSADGKSGGDGDYDADDRAHGQRRGVAGSMRRGGVCHHTPTHMDVTEDMWSVTSTGAAEQAGPSSQCASTSNNNTNSSSVVDKTNVRQGNYINSSMKNSNSNSSSKVFNNTQAKSKKRAVIVHTTTDNESSNHNNTSEYNNKSRCSYGGASSNEYREEAEGKVGSGVAGGGRHKLRHSTHSSHVGQILNKENLYQLHRQLSLGQTPLRPEVLTGLQDVVRGCTDATARSEMSSMLVEVPRDEGDTSQTDPHNTLSPLVPALTPAQSASSSRRVTSMTFTPARHAKSTTAHTSTAAKSSSSPSAAAATAANYVKSDAQHETKGTSIKSNGNNVMDNQRKNTARKNNNHVARAKNAKEVGWNVCETAVPTPYGGVGKATHEPDARRRMQTDRVVSVDQSMNRHEGVYHHDQRDSDRLRIDTTKAHALSSPVRCDGGSSGVIRHASTTSMAHKNNNDDNSNRCVAGSGGDVLSRMIMILESGPAEVNSSSPFSPSDTYHVGASFHSTAVEIARTDQLEQMAGNREDDEEEVADTEAEPHPERDGEEDDEHEALHVGDEYDAIVEYDQNSNRHDSHHEDDEEVNEQAAMHSAMPAGRLSPEKKKGEAAYLPGMDYPRSASSSSNNLSRHDHTTEHSRTPVSYGSNAAMVSQRRQVEDIRRTLSWMEQKVDCLNDTLVANMSSIMSHLDSHINLLSAKLASCMVEMHESWQSAVPATPVSQQRPTPLAMCYIREDGKEMNYVMPFDLGRSVLECKCEFARRLRRLGYMPAADIGDASASPATSTTLRKEEKVEEGRARVSSGHDTHDGAAGHDMSGSAAEEHSCHSGVSEHSSSRGAPLPPVHTKSEQKSHTVTTTQMCLHEEGLVLCTGNQVLFDEDVLYTVLGASPTSKSTNRTPYALTLRHKK